MSSLPFAVNMTLHLPFIIAYKQILNSCTFKYSYDLPFTKMKKSLDNERGGCPLSVQVTEKVRFLILS